MLMSSDSVQLFLSLISSLMLSAMQCKLFQDPSREGSALMLHNTFVDLVYFLIYVLIPSTTINNANINVIIRNRTK